MTNRILRLRERSLATAPSLSPERAVLLTACYASGAVDGVSEPVARALAFRHLLAHKAVCIEEGELIVGERGPSPKATPTYPELCTHSLEDLDLLDGREKIPYAVSEDMRQVYRDTIISFWNGRALRDRLFAAMDDDWRAAYEAGVFTEFMEQRAPGHTVLDDRIYRRGMRDVLRDIEARLDALDVCEDPRAYDRREELRAMGIAAEALIAFAHRHAERARELASAERDPERRAELEHIAAVCTRVPAEAPRTLWEALQAYWFVHLGVITELNTWDSFNPGRLDRHLWPFYRQDLETGTLSEDEAEELLQAFWIKFNNQPAPPKVGVTAQESNTYTDFCLINLGGVTEAGEDAVNPLTYVLLDVIESMRLLQPSSMVQVSARNPDRFVKRALRIVKTGFGQPSFFNTEALVRQLLRQGKTLADARNGGASGCVETGAFGKEAYWLTGYFNLVKVLELTLHDGRDPRTGRQVGLRTGHPASWTSFDDCFSAFERQLRFLVDVKIRGSQIIERLYARHLPAPFLSLLVDDCLARGLDYHDGGARYNTSYIQGVGLGTLSDALTALKVQVFERENLALSDIMDALSADFEGFDALHDVVLHETPKYGNDDDAADDVMRRIFEVFFQAVDGRPNTRGGHYRINLLPTTCHVYFGSVVGATPDGRRAGHPLSEGISPVQGADRNGPTAVVKSAAKMDHLRTGGTLLNQKFTPAFLASDAGVDRLAHLVRAYFRLDGHHIQFNVVSAETLRDAVRHPERYPELIVRVAGYSDYFVDLTPALQEEIIRRTEQAGC